MILVWAIAIVIFLVGLGICILLGYSADDGLKSVAGQIATVAVTTLLICGASLFWLYGTESGQRAIKDTKSNFGDGINRIVTVYDIDGEIIQQYEGKFDVDYDSERIKFDDEKGKRHVIYNKAGTVIIDEK